jgi:hypothetical protein
MVLFENVRCRFFVANDKTCITSRQLQNIWSGLESFMVKYHSISYASLHTPSYYICVEGISKNEIPAVHRLLLSCNLDSSDFHINGLALH